MARHRQQMGFGADFDTAVERERAEGLDALGKAYRLANVVAPVGGVGCAAEQVARQVGNQRNARRVHRNGGRDALELSQNGVHLGRVEGVGDGQGARFETLGSEMVDLGRDRRR